MKNSYEISPSVSHAPARKRPLFGGLRRLLNAKAAASLVACSLCISAQTAKADSVGSLTVHDIQTEEPESIGSTTSVSDLVVRGEFAGNDLTWEFINSLARDPVLDFGMVTLSGGTEMWLRVARGSKMVTLYLTDNEADMEGQGSYGGYAVSSRVAVESEINYAGDVDIFSDGGPFFKQTITVAQNFYPELLANPIEVDGTMLTSSLDKFMTAEIFYQQPNSSTRRVRERYYDIDGVLVHETSSTAVSDSAPSTGEEVCRAEGEAAEADFDNQMDNSLLLPLNAYDAVYEAALFSLQASSFGALAKTYKAGGGGAMSKALGLLGAASAAVSAQHKINGELRSGLKAVGGEIANALAYATCDRGDDAEVEPADFDLEFSNPEFSAPEDEGMYPITQCTEWKDAGAEVTITEVENGGDPDDISVEVEVTPTPAKCVKWEIIWV